MHTFGLTEKILFLYVPPYRLAPRFVLSPESLKFGKLDLLLSCYKHLIDHDCIYASL